MVPYFVCLGAVAPEPGTGRGARRHAGDRRRVAGARLPRSRARGVSRARADRRRGQGQRHQRRAGDAGRARGGRDHRPRSAGAGGGDDGGDARERGLRIHVARARLRQVDRPVRSQRSRAGCCASRCRSGWPGSSRWPTARGDVIVLRALSGDAEVGAYRAGGQLFEVAKNVPVVVMTAMFPQLARELPRQPRAPAPHRVGRVGEPGRRRPPGRRARWRWPPVSWRGGSSAPSSRAPCPCCTSWPPRCRWSS